MPSLLGLCVCARSISRIDFAAWPYLALIFSSIKLPRTHTSDKKCMLARSILLCRLPKSVYAVYVYVYIQIF